MSLSTGQDQYLRAMRESFRGVVSSFPLRSLLDALKGQSGIEVGVPDVKVKAVTAQTSTATVVVGGPCRFYGIRVVSGTAISAAQAAAALDVIANVLDGSVGVARTKCTKNKDAESFHFAGTDGTGIPIATSLSVSALAAADGASNPSAADRPTILVYYGV